MKRMSNYKKNKKNKKVKYYILIKKCPSPLTALTPSLYHLLAVARFRPRFRRRPILAFAELKTKLAQNRKPKNVRN